MTISPGEIAALAGIAVLGSMVFGITGFGAALISIPLSTHLVSLQFALALFVLMDLANAFRVGFENPKNAVRAEWRRMIPTIVLGTATGATLLLHLPRQAATAALGVFVLGFAVYSLVRRPGMQARIDARWAYLAGFAGGITSTLFGAGGPPYAIYLQNRGLSKEQYRATLGLSTLTSISFRTIAFLATGFLLDPKVWVYAIAVVPAGLVGLWAATHLFHRLSRDALMRVVSLVLAASGASLLLRALGS